MNEGKYPKEGSSGSSTNIGYTVEARYDSSEPKEFSGQLFDNRWRKVIFDKSTVGVPRCAKYDIEQFNRYGLLGYSAAQALRWWLHASAEFSIMGSLSLETKLIKHRIEASYKCEAISEEDIIPLMEEVR